MVPFQLGLFQWETVWKHSTKMRWSWGFFASVGLLLREALLNMQQAPCCPNITFHFKHNLMRWWLRFKWAFKLHTCVLSFFLYFCLASFLSEISISGLILSLIPQCSVATPFLPSFVWKLLLVEVQLLWLASPLLLPWDQDFVTLMKMPFVSLTQAVYVKVQVKSQADLTGLFWQRVISQNHPSMLLIISYYHFLCWCLCDCT